MQEPQVSSLIWEDPLEKQMATDSHVLVWRIPWTEEPGRQQPMGSQRVRYDWSNLARTSILAWKIPWTEEPGGLQSMGSQRVGHNFTTSQQQCFILNWELSQLSFHFFICTTAVQCVCFHCYWDSGKLHGLSKMMQQVDGKQDWYPHLWSLDPCSTPRNGNGEN